MIIYFNEIERFPAQWLRNYWAGSKVDERSITNVKTNDVAGFRRCHFFAGIGGWEIALQQAGWPEDRQVWTLSCPCQPFSTAGKQKGTADERHLWPEALRLVKGHHPVEIFGEQVAGKGVVGKLYTERAWERLEPEARRTAEEADKDAWFRHVQPELEREGYVVGHCVFSAASVGAPHARQRLYWYARYVGESSCQCDNRGRISGPRRRDEYPDNGRPDRVADDTKCNQRSLYRQSGKSVRQEEQAGGPGVSFELADLHKDRQHKGRMCFPETGRNGDVGNNQPVQLADTSEERYTGQCRQRKKGTAERCKIVGMALSKCERQEWNEGDGREAQRRAEHSGDTLRPGPTNGFWRAADWIRCRDTDAEGNHRWRPVEPGSSPLAYGIPYRVSKISSGLEFLGFSAKTFSRVLRESKKILSEARAFRKGTIGCYGNAIVIPQAEEFIRACMKETVDE